MPTYCFTIPSTGKQIDLRLAPSELAETVTLNDGQVAVFDFRRQAKSQVMGRARDSEKPKRAYPYYSDAFGVSPEQVPEVRECLKREHGIDTEYDAQGSAKITSRSHFKKMCKAYRYTQKS